MGLNSDFSTSEAARRLENSLFTAVVDIDSRDSTAMLHIGTAFSTLDQACVTRGYLHDTLGGFLLRFGKRTRIRHRELSTYAPLFESVVCA